MTMPVIEEGWGWVKVRMPERPNGSTAWLRVSDVGLSTTDYYMIVVRRDTTHVTVYKDGSRPSRCPPASARAPPPRRWAASSSP